MNAVKKSLISLHLTVILLGGTALFSRLVPLSAIDITLIRSVFACVALFAFLFLAKDKVKLHCRRDYAIAVGLGILMALHWVTYFAAMQYAGVSVGMIALFTFPVITVLIEPLFEKTGLVWQDIVSALAVVAGVYLIVPESTLENEITLGVLIGIASAVLYAFRNIIHRKHFKQYSGAKAMAWQTLVISIVMLPTIGNSIAQASTHDWLMLLLLGTVFTALPHALIAASLRHLRAKTFSLIACMQPLYGVALAIVVLDESPTLSTLIGGILITSASVYETLNAHKLHQADDTDK
ncbi:MAG: EamA/RhaT family transporter [Alteromonas sp.]|uniref:DMT family transporter n=1 Tax=unclassified Alteromonas TaxID=2614992 RepID=UPI0009041545|nr:MULTISPECIES: DMT family transporter [unclassified Alteromonas]APE04756.1 EamA family transporter [Alteromonas sp. RW2A1]AUC87143.1 EamA/RhaT family transporter [Alteromonas sp. MB-3u-76]MAI65613.1 EamA/RhaT family transporter [Alteromonas sp.]